MKFIVCYHAKMAVERSSDGRPPTIRRPPDEKSFSEKQRLSVSQMVDIVMTINSVQKSSKSDLSSTTFGFSKFAITKVNFAQGVMEPCIRYLLDKMPPIHLSGHDA